MSYQIQTECVVLNNFSQVESLIDQLNTQRGVYLSSGVEYPGRYTQFDLGFINPPLEIIGYAGKIIFNALNPRGEFLIDFFLEILKNLENIKINKNSKNNFELEIIKNNQKFFSEEERSLQPSVMTPVRFLIKNIKKFFKNNLNNKSNNFLDFFGFYGALGYELIFEFDPIVLSNQAVGLREPKLFHFYFPDEVFVINKRLERACQYLLEISFEDQDLNKINLKNISNKNFKELEKINLNLNNIKITAQTSDQDYEQLVHEAKNYMKRGEIFELVLSRGFEADCSGNNFKNKSEKAESFSDVFKRMKARNPSPYELFCQFGDEQLIGTSPEMFVRVSQNNLGKFRIESCPISGTVKRGQNAMEDEVQIRALLNSEKDHVELTMCTDVDRNDKSRICEPESINLISRRSIEKYSNLFHTVDHVEGILRPEFDGIDGLLSHLWAVTLTGAPKKNAVQLIENMEGMSRHWYGGAVGYLALNGDVNTAITIRTVNFVQDKNQENKNNCKAFYRAGASLVWDSVSSEEMEETKTKSAPFYHALGLSSAHKISELESLKKHKIGLGYKAVMIDNQDSFVHTLAGYFRLLGMEVLTYRAGVSLEKILEAQPDLIIHSPGPGTPSEFKVPETILNCAKTHPEIPQFGVCLGLQGMVEAFGGKLKYLEKPRHGKTWKLKHTNQYLMQGLSQDIPVGAYHSIIADKDFFPDCLEVLAENEQGDIMAIRHRTLPLMAVQFHPESILSLSENAGLKIIKNTIEKLVLKNKK